MFEGENERLKGGLVFYGVEGEGDLLTLPGPVGVPDLVILACASLLKNGCAVRAEFEEDDASCFRCEAAAAGVEALEFFRGVGWCAEDGAESRENGKAGEIEAESHTSDFT